MAEAGESSPHLDQREQRQAAAGAPIGALVIHEIIRDQGEEELDRSFNGLTWSGIAAGLSIGFSFLTQATLQAHLPDAGWRPLVSGFGYSIGFLIVILGRQQLFTETTLTALIPALTRRNLHTAFRTLRVWAIVLAANIGATWIFAAIVARPGIFPDPTRQAMLDVALHTLDGSFPHTLLTGGAAGWLIGLMVWLLPSADASRALIIILLTYVIAICQFPHAIAGSVEAAYCVFTGHATIGDYFVRFLIPTFLGNAVGGAILAALLNHAPLAEQLTEPK
ncbi:MAG TPA: formate/nitrite transporter family protein [Rhodopila sp.]|jgi:formate/nitrite transporter FocA (FNT family)|nr:formate/nitrite transporter family protein [Rhodopila sp.]